ncbi:MAG: FAD-dependent monooxygenase [Cyanobacteriota bacterium]|nr:FAD-dependent monooxygenase [Cyanobacteriota bacterium]
MTQTTEVLIIGAGPTGLTTAIELARRDVLLLFIDPNQAQNTRTAIDRIVQQSGDNLQVHVVLNNGLPESHDFGTSTLVDYRGDLETRLGEQTDRVLLLRPDGYVAFDQSQLDEKQILTELQAWIQESQVFRELALA